MTEIQHYHLETHGDSRTHSMGLEAYCQAQARFVAFEKEFSYLVC